jgi:hypothetical protein
VSGSWIRRADQFDSRSELWSSKLLKDANFANLKAGEVHSKGQRRLGRGPESGCRCCRRALAVRLLKAGNVDLENRPEALTRRNALGRRGSSSLDPINKRSHRLIWQERQTADDHDERERPEP